MKLLPVPGAPGYRIDCDNMVAYSMKRGVRKPEDQAWHLWFVRNDGTRIFIQSFKTEEQANKRRDYLTADWKEGTYIVEPSDIKIEEL